jgi:hypothetical protein
VLWLTPILLALWAPAAAQPAAAPVHPGALGGEAFTFRFSVGPIESGRARMAIGAPFTRRGHRLVMAHGDAETAHWLKIVLRVEDDYQLTFDPATLLPTDVTSVERGFRERHIAATLDGRNVEIDVKADQGAGHARRRMPQLVRDPMAALFALRAAPLGDGDVMAMDVLDGPALWRARLTAHRGVRVRLGDSLRPTHSHAGLDQSDAAGDRPAQGAERSAILITGEAARIDDAGRAVKMAPRRVAIWLSDDRDRVILRIESDSDLGAAAVELTSYIPPTSHRRPPAPPSLPGIAITPASKP